MGRQDPLGVEGTPTLDVEGPSEAEIDAAATEVVYDARGNVRPHGTPGARPMTYDERVAIAKRLADGEEIPSVEPVELEKDEGK